ncbi:MAG TPA: TPM domain-containing protein, partial [Candidatus Paceibacterota bacterium]|nr:TPM domain-containing protein [Candidatus Paceibacterota bacterium]
MTLFGRIGCIAALLVTMATAVAAQTYPKATGYVNDFAHLLTKEQGAALNQELVDFEKKTTLEIAVVTVPSLGGVSIERFTQGLANEWGVGKKGENNGIVFLVAPTERTMRIEVASGARALFSNAAADRVRDDAVLPRFRARDMPGGIVDGTHAIMRTVERALSREGNDVAPALQSAQAESDSFDFRWVLVIFGGIIVMVGG